MEQMMLRKLDLNDFPLVKNMKTTVEDDYVLSIYKKLTTSPEHAIYGLFKNESLLAIAGYSIYADRFAMLGRLRTNRDYQGRGLAAKILKFLREEARKSADIDWVGANTNLSNFAARRAIENSGLVPVTTIYSTVISNHAQLKGTNGSRWGKVEGLDEKRELLSSLNKKSWKVFPYECYYPLPLQAEDLSTSYLNESAFYVNPDKSRFLSIKEDQKRDWYAHVKYFWDDHFEQPGFFETLLDYQISTKKPLSIWIDFSEEGFKKIPDKEAFEISDPWILYGKWTKQ